MLRHGYRGQGRGASAPLRLRQTVTACVLTNKTAKVGLRFELTTPNVPTPPGSKIGHADRAGREMIASTTVDYTRRRRFCKRKNGRAAQETTGRTRFGPVERPIRDLPKNTASRPGFRTRPGGVSFFRVLATLPYERLLSPYAFRPRRRSTSPARPRPISTSVPGSGTAAGASGSDSFACSCMPVCHQMKSLSTSIAPL